MNNKKKVGIYAVLLVILSCGLVSGAKEDWLQLVDNTEQCINCYTDYRICVPEALTPQKENIALTWQDLKGLIPQPDNRVENFQVSVKNTQQLQREVPVYGWVEYDFLCDSVPTYNESENTASCLDGKGIKHTFRRVVSVMLFWITYENLEQTGTKLEDYEKTTYTPLNLLQVKDTLAQSVLGTCIDIRLTGTIKQGDRVDHYLTWGGYEFKEYAWWSALWNHKKLINITCSETMDTVAVEIDMNTQAEILAGESNSDCSDTRFLNSAENETLYYWIMTTTGNKSSCDSPTTTFVVNISCTTGVNNTIYRYYGNAGASPVSNFTDHVFSFADDFDRSSSSTVGNGWVETESGGSTCSISGNKLKIDDVNDNAQAVQTIPSITRGKVWAKAMNTEADSKSGYFSYVTVGGYPGTTAYYEALDDAWTKIIATNLVSAVDSTWYSYKTVFDADSDTVQGAWVENTSYIDSPIAFSNGVTYVDTLTAITGGGDDLFVLYLDYVAVSNFTNTTVTFGSEENVSAVSLTLDYNHTELNSSITYNDINITLTSSINVTSCNITFDGTVYDAVSVNNTYYYYEFNDTSDYNHTYYANCTNGSTIINTSSGWTYVNTALNLSWDWDDINSTIATTSSTVWVNSTNTDVCILHFNGTDYTMTQSGERFYQAVTSLTNGNYSSINVTCNDTLNNTNQTSNAWVNVSLSAILPGGTNFSYGYYCPPIAFVNIPFVVWAELANETDGTPVIGATVAVDNITDSTPLPYNATSEDYREYFISTVEFTWTYNITIQASGFNSTNISCETELIDPFNLTIRIWEEVALRTYHNTSEYIVTVKNYDKQLTDSYINDFGYIIARNNDQNASGAYTYCNFPFGSAQSILGIINVGNWMGDTITNLTTSYVGEYIGCENYWFRAEYLDGEATLNLPYIGNYSIYFVEGTIQWENQFSPPKIVKSNLFLPLGEVMIPDKSDWVQDYWVSHEELDWFGALTDSLFIYLVTLLPILIFVALILAGVSWRFAGSIALGWGIIWTILRMLR